MKIVELRAALSSFNSVLEHWQASKGNRSDLERLVESLEAFDDLTVSQFCKQLDGAFGEKPQSKAKRSSSNMVVVQDYAKQLTAAIGDPIVLEGVLAKMRADKAVRMGELNDIAMGFVGGTKRYSNKTDAYKDIKLRAQSHLNAAQRADAASDVF